MMVIDLHPEDLLDKDVRGELTDDERARLNAHLARCAACRAEQIMRADFADELDGEDRPSALMGLVQGALAAPRTVAPAPVVADGAGETELGDLASAPRREAARTLATSSGRPGRTRRTAVVLLAAAAVLMAGAAGATGLTARVWRSLRAPSEDLTRVSASAPTASPPMPRAPMPASSAPAPAPGEGEPEARMTEAPSPAPHAALTAAPVGPTSPSAPAPAFGTEMDVLRGPLHRRIAPMEPRSAPTASPPVPSAIASASASDLFDSANSARRSGDMALALGRYDALERQFPGSREARVAKATTAKLLLDRGDAAGALRRFDAYLASGSSELREEAMAGRATALERLGRADDEARAWAALLKSYPSTPYAPHAQARQAVLAASSNRGPSPR